MRLRFGLVLTLLLGWYVATAYGDQIQELSLSEELDALYSTRLLFNQQGVPQISVGIMEAQRSISVNLEASAKLVYYTPERKSINIEAGSRINVRFRKYRRGKCRYLVVVKKLSWRQKELLPKLEQQWKNRGYAVWTKRTGALQGLSGVLLDTRQYLVAVGKFEVRSEAEALRRELFEIFRVRAEIVEELIEKPHAELVVRITNHGSKPKTLKSHDLVWIELTGTATVVRQPRNSTYERKRIPQKRRYRGKLYVVIDHKGGLTLADMLDIEQMLESVVPAEIFPSAPIEALKAQAVAARNQILLALGTRHLADPFALCDTQHCQVMAGVDAETKRTHKAIEATRGLFLFDSRGLVNTAYSALAGGFTENSETHWTGAADPALRGKLDAPQTRTAYLSQFENGITEDNIRAWIFSPPQDLYPLKTKFNRKYFRWHRTFSAAELNRLVARKHPKAGRIKDLEVLSRGISGRIKALRVIGTRSSFVVQNPYELRQLFGGLPSSAFIVEIKRSATGDPESFTFHGAGWGHGVGMCQTGAIGRAESGQSFEQILHHYYTGAELKRLYK